MTPNPAHEAWIDRAREKDILEMAGALGARLKKAGAAELIGPCPLCGGTDRFSINTKRRVFNCRGSGQGGDVIEMVRHVRGCDFIAACEEITGEPPPRGDSHKRESDPDIERERREEKRDAEIARAKEEAADLVKAKNDAADLFARSIAIEGTAAEDYLYNRGVLIGQSAIYNDVRFIPNLPYFGFLDHEANEQVELGRFHCMVSAVRDAAGEIIGVHRTYLSPDGAKLKPPGDRTRNKAKKAYKRVGGGMIRLSQIGELLAIGEGVETTLSWFALARLGYFGDQWASASIACAVSLGNLVGSATGSVPHPTANGRTIMNGEPDTARPGLVIPHGVKCVILIGDGDSDAATTRAAIMTGARRFRRLGLDVFVHMSPAGMDWNDVLIDGKGAA